MREKLILILAAAAIATVPPIGGFRADEGDPQKDQEDQATALIGQAKKSFDEMNFERAARKSTQFLQQFPDHPEAASARYYLTLSKLEAPDIDWSSFLNELEQALEADIPDKTRLHYWRGVALRITGDRQLEAVESAKPEEQAALRAQALERLAQSASAFATAEAALVGSSEPPPGAGGLPPALDLAARARVEGAEALLRSGKTAEVVQTLTPFETDPLWSRSTQRQAALLCLGEAQLTAGQYAAAFKTLAALAPFQQEVELRARYLLGRILEETGEKPEALLQYELIAKAYPVERQKREEALRDPNRWKGRALERRAEALARSVPESVAMSAFHAGLIQLEQGQYAEARARFGAYLQALPRSRLAPWARLYQGICMVQLKQGEAVRVLGPLAESPSLGDQATWWIGKLHRILADANNPLQAQKHHRAAAALFSRAAERAQAMGAMDPAARSRWGDILLDWADTLTLLKQHKEAAAIYDALANETPATERTETAHERWAISLARSGEFEASVAALAGFLEKYPRSTAKPSVLFWQAENASNRGVELARNPETAAAGLKLQEEAVARYQTLLDRYPSSDQASAARFGAGMTHYRRGAFQEAAKLLGGIPDADRTGELVKASYYHGDALVRTLPPSADDALSAARLAKQLEAAQGSLSRFVGSNTKAPEMPEAMLKLADCYQRSAELVADHEEKARLRQSARETYDQLLQGYPKHPSFAQAYFERACLLEALGDAGGAMSALNRFRAAPQLQRSAIAPAALMRLSTIMVSQGRAADAAAMLEKYRAEFEAVPSDGAARDDQIVALRLHHGVALKESSRPQEALALFVGIIKQYPDHPAAVEAALASIQVRRDEVLSKLSAARKAIAAAPREEPVDRQLLSAQAVAMKEARDMAEAFAAHAGRIGASSAGSDLHVRTLRDAAATWRAVGEAEREDPRRPSLEAIPLRPAEKKAREYYALALEVGGDSPASAAVLLELGEMHVERGEADAAIQLLGAALEKNPPPRVADELRVKLGGCHLLKGEAKEAIEQSVLALRDTKSPIRPAAYLLKGRALMAQGSWVEAITCLTRFRSGTEKYQNAGPATEEGLLRLAEAHAAAGSLEECRAIHEHLLARFPESRWAPEALFGMATVLLQLEQTEQAKEVLRRLVRDHPQTRFAVEAVKRLKEIP